MRKNTYKVTNCYKKPRTFSKIICYTARLVAFMVKENKSKLLYFFLNTIYVDFVVEV